MERHFEGKKEAGLYKRYRPNTPQILVDKVMNYVRDKLEGPLNCMVDVGCGNGQNTLVFIPHFEKVLGTDISANMLSEVANDSTLPARVTFAVSPAEKLPVADESVELVAAAQCYHWFDHDKFHQEMNRVLKPNGVVAILGHELHLLSDPHDEKKSDELLNVIIEYFIELAPYFQNALHFLLNRYIALPFPYKDVIREYEIRSEFPITLADYLGLMDTYSQFQKWYSEKPEAAIASRNKLTKGLTRVLEVDEGTPYDKVNSFLRLENFLILGRK